MGDAPKTYPKVTSASITAAWERLSDSAGQVKTEGALAAVGLNMLDVADAVEPILDATFAAAEAQGLYSDLGGTYAFAVGMAVGIAASAIVHEERSDRV